MNRRHAIKHCARAHALLRDTGMSNPFASIYVVIRVPKLIEHRRISSRFSESSAVVKGILFRILIKDTIHCGFYKKPFCKQPSTRQPKI